jgi:hypothetical protein
VLSRALAEGRRAGPFACRAVEPLCATDTTAACCGARAFAALPQPVEEDDIRATQPSDGVQTSLHHGHVQHSMDIVMSRTTRCRSGVLHSTLSA